MSGGEKLPATLAHTQAMLIGAASCCSLSRNQYFSHLARIWREIRAAGSQQGLPPPSSATVATGDGTTSNENEQMTRSIRADPGGFAQGNAGSSRKHC